MSKTFNITDAAKYKRRDRESPVAVRMMALLKFGELMKCRNQFFFCINFNIIIFAFIINIRTHIFVINCNSMVPRRLLLLLILSLCFNFKPASTHIVRWEYAVLSLCFFTYQKCYEHGRWQSCLSYYYTKISPFFSYCLNFSFILL